MCWCLESHTFRYFAIKGKMWFKKRIYRKQRKYCGASPWAFISLVAVREQRVSPFLTVIWWQKSSENIAICSYYYYWNTVQSPSEDVIYEHRFDNKFQYTVQYYKFYFLQCLPQNPQTRSSGSLVHTTKADKGLEEAKHELGKYRHGILIAHASTTDWFQTIWK